MRLGQALQNRRKYENDLKNGKRKRKNRYKNMLPVSIVLGN